MTSLFVYDPQRLLDVWDRKQKEDGEDRDYNEHFQQRKSAFVLGASACFFHNDFSFSFSVSVSVSFARGNPEY